MLWAFSASAYLTKAVPLGVFVCLSITILAHLTLPYRAKNCFSCSSSIFGGRLRINIVEEQSSSGLGTYLGSSASSLLSYYSSFKLYSSSSFFVAAFASSFAAFSSYIFSSFYNFAVMNFCFDNEKSSTMLLPLKVLWFKSLIAF
jgi:hypothetical protein